MVVGIIIAALLLLALAAGYGAFRFACVWGRRIDPLDRKTYQKGVYAKNGAVLYENANALAEIPAEDLYITSFDGLRLHGRFLPLDGAKGTILLFHGFHSFADVDFGCAVPLLREMGYQLLLVDERAHQGSEGKYLTFGVKERRDVLSWARAMAARLGPAHPMYLQGISMGASTVLMAADQALPTNVRGIVADCGFTSPAEIVRRVMPMLKVPSVPLLYLMELWCRLLAGFSLWGYSTERAMENCRVPVLFVHGKADGLIPWEMTQRSYEACASDKSVLYVDGAGHGESFLVDRPACEQSLREFFEKTAADGRLPVRVQLLRQGATLPVYGSAAAAGADLRACLDETVEIAPGQTVMIPTGLALELPEGWAGLVYARSGLAGKRGLAPANKVGVIDADYRGEVLVALHNHGTQPQSVEPGERIAQLVLAKAPQAAFTAAESLSNTDRGSGGFGSTGKK